MSEQLIYRATGRRKAAVARVILRRGTGSRIINGKSFKEYFANSIRETLVEKPLTILKANNDWDVTVTSNGGGVSGQAGAVQLGIARALLAFNQENKKALREEGLLTRDSREVERKKYGRAGARKSFQFSKR